MTINEANEQSEPVLDGSLDATLDAKRQGILDQVAADSTGLALDDVIAGLTQRLAEAEVPTSDARIRELAAMIVS
ncbi:hypothetical protein GY21_03730 [Cryobacterium roopkundense]|uniref:Uncharacterized protein n=1 Tax=Cryobacterium roopkundense TaxID=1001240 RepID=A0A099JQ78_9MICO|nr:hypothetical protein [Cryobacterium roopkundense]KGJ79777.1 hypothetical protein GY21_03730 [Cryobacterium roopkundense]MBB5640266.1 hypothetical protein [Cryobacterium roopkundense]